MAQWILENDPGAKAAAAPAEERFGGAGALPTRPDLPRIFSMAAEKVGPARLMAAGSTVAAAAAAAGVATTPREPEHRTVHILAKWVFLYLSRVLHLP